MGFNNAEPLARIKKDRTFRLVEALTYKTKDGSRTYIVPIGFETDLASVPRIFWSIVPPHGRYSCAAIVHDFLYTVGKVTRKEADDLFLEMMEELGVSWFRRKIMYRAVRMFGKGNFK